MYRAKVRLKGCPALTATFKHLTDTRRWAAKTETDLRDGRHFALSEGSRHTVGDLIDRYERDVLPHKRSNGNNLQPPKHPAGRKSPARLQTSIWHGIAVHLHHCPAPARP